jgi:hypothetical protein
VFPGDVVQGWLAGWRENPTVLVREFAMSRYAREMSMSDRYALVTDASYTSSHYSDSFNQLLYTKPRMINGQLQVTW